MTSPNTIWNNTNTLPDSFVFRVLKSRCQLSFISSIGSGTASVSCLFQLLKPVTPPDPFMHLQSPRSSLHTLISSYYRFLSLCGLLWLYWVQIIHSLLPYSRCLHSITSSRCLYNVRSRLKVAEIRVCMFLAGVMAWMSLPNSSRLETWSHDQCDGVTFGGTSWWSKGRLVPVNGSGEGCISYSACC